MNILLLIASILPGLGISYWIYHMDKHEKEPHKYLLICFFLGMLSTVPALKLEEFGTSMGYEEGINPFTTFILAFVVVALSEEFCKFFFLTTYMFPKKDFNEPMDGIVYSMMIGMGFATLENIHYAFQFGMETTLYRMFTAVPAHAAFAVIMGYFVGLAKFQKGRSRIFLLCKGLFYATLLHGAYDFFIFQNMYEALSILAFAALYLGIHLSNKMIKLHQDSSPFREYMPKERVPLIFADKKNEQNKPDKMLSEDALKDKIVNENITNDDIPTLDDLFSDNEDTNKPDINNQV